MVDPNTNHPLNHNTDDEDYYNRCSICLQPIMSNSVMTGLESYGHRFCRDNAAKRNSASFINKTDDLLSHLPEEMQKPVANAARAIMVAQTGGKEDQQIFFAALETLVRDFKPACAKIFARTVA
jgi:hypothetical protein